ncbi:MAG: hypothetical protein AAF927_18615 [Bacteroidota bacterium]
MHKKRLIQKFLRWGGILSLFILFSCEGFKVLTVQNKSDSAVKLIVKPSLGEFNKANITSYPTYQTGDSSIVLLAPDSSVVLLSTFTSMLFSVKIKARDLRSDYLRIEMTDDTLLADSKAEIINLIYGKSEKAIESKGRNLVSLRLH